LEVVGFRGFHWRWHRRLVWLVLRISGGRRRTVVVLRERRWLVAPLGFAGNRASAAVLDCRQDRHPVVGDPHFPVALAARATKPGPVHGDDLRVRSAANVGRHQAAGPLTRLVRAGYRVTA